MKNIISLLSILLCAQQCLPAQQAFTLSAEHEKPTQEELQTFFRSVHSKSAHPKVFELVQKYGKNIVNEKLDGLHEELDQDPILCTLATDEFFSPENYEKLLQVPGVNPDIISIRTGGTPLLIAISSIYEHTLSEETLSKIRLLIRYGADVNLQDKNTGWTPMLIAARDNRHQVVPLLLQQGATGEGIVTTKGKFSGKTFFDFAKKNPVCLQAYKVHKKKLIGETTEFFNGYQPLGEVVASYLLSSE